MQRQWLSKEVAARRAKANGCQRKSQRDVLSITRRSHLTIGTLRFATTDGWTRVARCLGDWIEYGALWRVVVQHYNNNIYWHFHE